MRSPALPRSALERGVTLPLGHDLRPVDPVVPSCRKDVPLGCGRARSRQNRASPLEPDIPRSHGELGVGKRISSTLPSGPGCAAAMRARACTWNPTQPEPAVPVARWRIQASTPKQRQPRTAMRMAKRRQRPHDIPPERANAPGQTVSLDTRQIGRDKSGRARAIRPVSREQPRLESGDQGACPDGQCNRAGR